MSEVVNEFYALQKDINSLLHMAKKDLKTIGKSAGEEANTEQEQSFVVWPFVIKEFEFIRDNFETNNLACLEKMLRIIQMWQWRCNEDQAPIIIIDLTKLILQCIIFDRRHVIEKIIEIPDAEDNAQLIYASALARFVNYINQLCNPVIKNGHLGNMYASAYAVGIPNWVVRLRHNAVHVHLPALSELRRAADFCRTWLYDVHWKQQIEIAFLSINSAITKPPPKRSAISAENFQKHVQEYCKLTMKKMASADAREKLKFVTLGMKGMLLADPKNLINIIANALIIQSQKRMSDMNFKCPTETAWQLPSTWENFWRDMIQVVQECSMMSQLMICCADGVLNSDSSFIKVQFAAWLSSLIGTLKLTDRVASYQSLTVIAEKMIRSKLFHRRESFIYILNSMQSHLTAEQQQRLLEDWDQDNSEFNESLLMEHDDNSDMNFALVNPKTSLGLIDEQTKDTLDLQV